VKDCYINEQSWIIYDDVDNIQPSITGFPGDISTGIKAAYSRLLNTGDSQDIIIYANSIVQVCIISSTQDFKGNGTETGNPKICSFLSMHQAADGYY
jgi:predicted nuclease of predicted toxin-antitoxin system